MLTSVADGAVAHDDVPSPQRDGGSLLHLERS